MVWQQPCRGRTSHPKGAMHFSAKPRDVTYFSIRASALSVCGIHNLSQKTNVTYHLHTAEDQGDPGNSTMACFEQVLRRIKARGNISPSSSYISWGGCGRRRVWQEEGVAGGGCGRRRVWQEEGVAGGGCGRRRVWQEEGVAGGGCGRRRRPPDHLYCTIFWFPIQQYCELESRQFQEQV